MPHDLKSFWAWNEKGLTEYKEHFLGFKFSFLMAEAIMCHYNQNVLTFSFRRNTKTLIHLVLQVLGGGIGIAGVLIQLIHDKFDLFNVHAKLGFAAFILCLISFVTGLSALFSNTLKRFLSPLLNKTFHNILGMSTFVVALVAQYYGYNTGLFTRNVPTKDFVILMKCLTLISAVLTSLGPLKTLIYKLKVVISQYSVNY
ncbi:uncharacterized protein LOC111686408 [Lucilia cuprina]|uniref:uncharacterized protein LOC111686408 n=1 Tax=Lucilia cuprina TaxID=7375 RepID=UPI001F057179|nr:uncharacterized protein LOC111686408 [Lucilia cuprina]